MKKRVISLILAVVMVFGTMAVGLTAFADDATETTDTTTSTRYDIIDGDANYHYIVKLDSNGDVISKEQGEHEFDTDTKTCTKCGYVHDCDKDGHIFGETPSSYDETAHYYKCEACGEEEPFEHVWEIGYATSSAYHWIACRDCSYKKDYGYHVDEELNYIDDDGEATTDGLCDICKNELQHRWKKESNTDATCTTKGSNNYECINCESTYTEDVPAIGHDWTDSKQKNYAVEWSDDNNSCTLTFTCLHTGCEGTLKYTVYYGGKDTDNVIVDEANVADIGYERNTTEYPDPKEATCTESGYKYIYAKFTVKDASGEGWYGWGENDDGTFSKVFVKKIEVAATGHDFDGNEWTYTEATCKANGSKSCLCNNCNKTITEEFEGTKLSHGFSEYEITKEPTCVDAGEKTGYCTVCGEEATEEIPATGVHEWKVSKIVHATCTTEGYTVYKCEVCGETKKDDAVPATGHSYVAHQDITNGKLTYDHGFVCEYCGDVTGIGSHVDRDFDLVCDTCGGSISFAEHWLHYITGWPVYYFRVVLSFILDGNFGDLSK